MCVVVQAVAKEYIAMRSRQEQIVLRQELSSHIGHASSTHAGREDGEAGDGDGDSKEQLVKVLVLALQRDNAIARAQVRRCVIMRKTPQPRVHGSVPSSVSPLPDRRLLSRAGGHWAHSQRTGCSEARCRHSCQAGTARPVHAIGNGHDGLQRAAGTAAC